MNDAQILESLRKASEDATATCPHCHSPKAHPAALVFECGNYLEPRWRQDACYERELARVRSELFECREALAEVRVWKDCANGLGDELSKTRDELAEMTRQRDNAIHNYNGCWSMVLELRAENADLRAGLDDVANRGMMKHGRRVTTRREARISHVETARLHILAAERWANFQSEETERAAIIAARDAIHNAVNLLRDTEVTPTAV